MEIKEYTNIYRDDYIIEGTYGDKKIKISTFPSENSHNIIVNIHGTFGSLNGGNDKYLNFAEKISQFNLAGAVLYSSSRKDLEIDKNISDIYKQKQSKFIGKTFNDELEDSRRVLLWLIENSQNIFGVKRENLKITINGNSLGGILAFYLSAEFPEIKNISTVGTGLRLEIKDVPILNTFPDSSEIVKILHKFRGKFLMHYGSEDSVFTSEAFEKFYNNVLTEDKFLFHMIGVDHTFGKLGGEKSSTPYREIFQSLKTLLQNGEIISGEISMNPRVVKTISKTTGIINKTLFD